MATLQSQDIVRRSATTFTPPAARHQIKVAKLIDVSKCIGCKACQAACLEWNNLREDVGVNVGQYQNPHDLTANSWTLMRFTEWVNPETDNLEWLIRKDGCMHCEDPGCLKACPSPGAIVQYSNGIVDFVSENCIGCGYCIKGCRSTSRASRRPIAKRISARFASIACPSVRRRLAPNPARPRRSCSAPRKRCSNMPRVA